MFDVAVLVCLALAPPLNDDAPFQEGLRLFDEYEYEKAVFRFREAAMVPARSESDQAIIQVWLGMTFAELGDFTSAAAAFDQAVAFDHEVAPPPDAAPKVKDLLDEARARLAKAPSKPAAPPTTSVPAARPAPAGVESMEKAPAPEKTVAAAEPAPAPAASLRWPLLSAGGAAAVIGVVALGGGLGLGALALSRQDDALLAPYQQDAAQARGEAETAALAANGMYVLAAGLIGTGALLSLFGVLDGGS